MRKLRVAVIAVLVVMALSVTASVASTTTTTPSNSSAATTTTTTPTAGGIQTRPHDWIALSGGIRGSAELVLGSVTILGFSKRERVRSKKESVLHGFGFLFLALGAADLIIAVAFAYDIPDIQSIASGIIAAVAVAVAFAAAVALMIAKFRNSFSAR